MTTELVAQLRLRLVDEVSGEARRVQSAMKLATGGVSSAVEQLRLKQLEASTAARTLQTEHRRLVSSGTATEAQLREVSTALVRAREAAAGYATKARDLAAAERAAAGEASRLASTQRAAATEVNRGAAVVARGADDVARASKAQTRGMAEAVNMGTEMALGFGGLSPQLRELSIGLAMGGNNAVTMAAALGPVGIGLGLITGVLPTLITQLVGSTSATDASTDAHRRHADAAKRDADEIDGVVNAHRRYQRMISGTARYTETAERLERAINQRDRTQMDLTAARAQVTARETERRRVAGGSFREQAAAERALREARNRVTSLERRLATEERTVEQRSAESLAALSGEGREEDEDAQREEVRARPQQIRSSLEDLATARGLSDAQRAQLITAAQRGRALPEGLARALGPEADRARALVGELGGAERLAARSRLDEAGGAAGGTTSAETEEVVTRVRRARRPAVAAAAAEASPGPPPADWNRIASSLEELVVQGRRGQRVDVNVNVADDRVRADAAADASAPDFTGGQR